MTENTRHEQLVALREKAKTAYQEVFAIGKKILTEDTLDIDSIFTDHLTKEQSTFLTELQQQILDQSQITESFLSSLDVDLGDDEQKNLDLLSRAIFFLFTTKKTEAGPASFPKGTISLSKVNGLIELEFSNRLDLYSFVNEIPVSQALEHALLNDLFFTIYDRDGVSLTKHVRTNSFSNDVPFSLIFSDSTVEKVRAHERNHYYLKQISKAYKRAFPEKKSYLSFRRWEMADLLFKLQVNSSALEHELPQTSIEILNNEQDELLSRFSKLLENMAQDEILADILATDDTNHIMNLLEGQYTGLNYQYFNALSSYIDTKRFEPKIEKLKDAYYEKIGEQTDVLVATIIYLKQSGEWEQEKPILYGLLLHTPISQWARKMLQLYRDNEFHIRSGAELQRKIRLYKEMAYQYVNAAFGQTNLGVIDRTESQSPDFLKALTDLSNEFITALDEHKQRIASTATTRGEMLSSINEVCVVTANKLISSQPTTENVIAHKMLQALSQAFS